MHDAATEDDGRTIQPHFSHLPNRPVPRPSHQTISILQPPLKPLPLALKSPIAITYARLFHDNAVEYDRFDK